MVPNNVFHTALVIKRVIHSKDSTVKQIVQNLLKALRAWLSCVESEIQQLCRENHSENIDLPFTAKQRDCHMFHTLLH